jgi:hypothetical protein
MDMATTYSIVGDTIQKSPESAEMKFVYSAILIDRGEYAKARNSGNSQIISGFFMMSVAIW